MNYHIISLIRKLREESNRVVKFVSRGTPCPVCEYLGMRGQVKTLRTGSDGIRYCECQLCGTHFRAYSEKTKEIEIEKVQLSCTSEKKTNKLKMKAKGKGKTKNGRH